MRLENRVGELADSMLEKLLLSERQRAEGESKIGVLPDGHENLWGCDFHLVDAVAEEMEGGSRFYLLTDRFDYIPGVWPVDIALAVPKEDHTFLSRVATVPASALRGKVRIVPARCVTLSHARLRSSAWDAETRICGLVGGVWISVGVTVIQGRGNRVYKAHDETKEDRSETNNTIRMALAAELTERYSWHVAFGFSNDGPRLVLPTNPTGCLALFKSRWAAPGETRRGALRHWVNAHYRERAADPGALDYVREHLRGHTRFIWNGLECELMVSAYDLEKNEFFRTQAAEWRAARKHNRVRLRLKRSG